jgi:signal peptidase II
MSSLLRKARVFWPLLFLLVLSDCATKRWAETHLTAYTPEPAVGEVVRWTLAYNRAAAMGITLGDASRPVLILATLVALAALLRFYRAAGPGDVGAAAASALIAGGALGNLIDRVRWTGGVVDFIDVGVGASRFWIFNVADVGVTGGAARLAWLLLRRDRAARDAADEAIRAGR